MLVCVSVQYIRAHCSPEASPRVSCIVVLCVCVIYILVTMTLVSCSDVSSVCELAATRYVLREMVSLHIIYGALRLCSSRDIRSRVSDRVIYIEECM